MIFQDSTNRRWRITVITSIILVSIIGLLLGLYVYSFRVDPSIPSLSKIDGKKGKIKKLDSTQVQDQGYKNDGSWIDNSIPKSETLNQLENESKNNQGKDLPKLNNGSFIHSAFIVQNDPKSVSEMMDHINDLDLVFPDCFTFTGKKDEIDENVDDSLVSFYKENNTKVFARIANNDKAGNWLDSSFTGYISSSDNRTLLCSLILESLQRYGFKGINLDFESIYTASKEDYLKFLIELKDLLHKNNMYLTIDVPMNDEAFDYEAIGNIADMVIVMAYDEHYPTGTSGPVASQNWFNDGINNILKLIPADKLIVATGQYSYDWNITKQTPADSLGFAETMALAREAGANVHTEKQSMNSTFSYQESNGDSHDVWMLDGISLWNEMQILKSYNVSGISLWRIGIEDPTIWDFYTNKDIDSVNPSILQQVRTSNLASFNGSGTILKVETPPQEGKRTLTFNNKLVDYSNYSVLPSPNYQVQKFGQGKSHNVALTFDDGPDPAYTNKILDVLKKYNVNATFFVVGSQVEKYPEVVKREVEEGNLIGNHTYSHPNISQISEQKLKSELNSTQRIIEEVTGKETLLFRSPYSVNLNPDTFEELIPLYNAGKLGYTVVNANVDSDDYKRPGVDKIVDTVVSQLNESESNVILMHDAGGNREQTAAALDKMIPLLINKGYKFVNVNDILEVPKSSLMPNASLKEKFIVWNERLWASVKSFGLVFIAVSFIVCTTFSILRILFFGFLVLKPKKNKSLYNQDDDFQPFVSVVIPAYNEEKVIAKTLHSLLQSNYNNFEVLVIDDGSKDNTREVAQEFSRVNSKVRVISKLNGGKHSALNLAFQEAKSEYIVTIDADTIILPDTIKHLVAPFKDPKIDAVCGNVKVGNIKNLITGFQAVEYITSQNYDRRAFDEINCIPVVPGATGGWRKEKVLSLGGYSDLTLTEDADLTLTMLENGAKIVYAPDAVSITEAPENTRDLFKQRFRWTFGTYQCLWKHKESFFKGRLGWFTLPYMYIFQLILPIISPITDIVILSQIFSGNIKAIVMAMTVFLFMEFVGPLIAFKVDRTPLKYIGLIFMQRFFYRQFMYVVTFKSIIACIKGNSHGWNKLNRTSSVEINGMANGDINTSEMIS